MPNSLPNFTRYSTKLRTCETRCGGLCICVCFEFLEACLCQKFAKLDDILLSYKEYKRWCFSRHRVQTVSQAASVWNSLPAASIINFRNFNAFQASLRNLNLTTFWKYWVFLRVLIGLPNIWRHISDDWSCDSQHTTSIICWKFHYDDCWYLQMNNLI